ncbi:RtcB family protein [Halorhodospira halochloris]|uniref:RtcB family protein n=1 Tax=Halorhodospira halochloris TaxID=1052 RepID=UPI001EE80ABA|nr:RtcB family protein [Halorhodospira halochloris]MCG5529716.1 RtcB family protein [Halorhodospira halochloris]
MKQLTVFDRAFLEERLNLSALWQWFFEKRSQGVKLSAASIAGFFSGQHPEQVDFASIYQLMDAASEGFVVRAAGMPDMHQGYALPIGGVVATQDVVVPAWVGYDIGCGMCAAPTSFSVEEILANRQLIFRSIYRRIPVGTKGHNKPIVDPERELGKLPDNKTRSIYKSRHGDRQCGTLGGGNHFIEIGVADSDQRVWIVLHSGSRGPGHGVAGHFMKLASSSSKAKQGHYGLSIDSAEGQSYLASLDWMTRFALLNRRLMLESVEQALQDIDLAGEVCMDELVNRNHNHAEPDANGYYIHRKGATHAEVGMAGVIPGDMSRGSYLVRGLGNAQALNSSSHGAGRKLGRRQAKQQLDIEQFRTTMQQANVQACVTPGTLDEAPGAYKDIHDIIALQIEYGLIEQVDRIRPLINIKEQG